MMYEGGLSRAHARRAVQSEANRLKKSQLMTEINKAKKTWHMKGYDSGFKDGDKEGYQRGVHQYKVTYPCSVCGGELVMMPGARDHEAMKSMMKQAGWAHSTCLSNK
jgi:flagellar biosynthesis/type III secretory pathway protein FliH